METIFANTGKRIQYKGAEFKIIDSGIGADEKPYVHLEPKNKELARRMRDEIRKRGNLTVRIDDGVHRLLLGTDEYPYW